MFKMIRKYSSPLVLCIAACQTLAQNAPPATTGPASAPPPSRAAVPFDPRNYLPACSTEKVNGSCFFNIDRRYPITLPAFQMRRGSTVTVYVFHPLAYESLRLDAGTAQAFEGSDQISALIAQVIPIGKGAVVGTLMSTMSADVQLNNNFMGSLGNARSPLDVVPNPPSDVTLAKEILTELAGLNDLLTDALDPAPKYFKETKDIYAQIREIESPQPSTGRHSDVPPETPVPSDLFPEWRTYLTREINSQGSDTTGILDRLPGACQKSTDPAPAIGPWLPSARPCNEDNKPGVQNSSKPFAIPAGYDDLYRTLTSNIALLPADRPDADTYVKIQGLKTQLGERKQRVSDAIPLANEVLPILIAKISPDMQTLLANIRVVQDTQSNPIKLGVIPPPPTSKNATPEEKLLAPYNALAPQNTYTVNAQNEIANSLLVLPAATQKQAIATITVLYAAPRFELSTGAFLSLLPNRTFTNVTDVAIAGGVPAPADVRIELTKTIPPLVIPYVAANYRIGPEFTWLGKRRGAFYATTAIALNPYNTQVEYAAGFSLSWRFLMFSPLFHIGHAVHLTQGEQVGQIWCQYGNGAAATSTPPACAGPPPAPSTTTYWRGAFAFGIGVRVPTTFISTNH